MHERRRWGYLRGSTALQKEADHLDHQVTIIVVLQAERKNTRKNFGYGWSPKLAKAGQEITFWKNCVRCFKQGVRPATQMSPALTCKNYGIQNQKKEQKFYQNKLEDAWTKLTLVQDNAKAHRKENLDKKR
jgi:hypothetical protein